MMEQDQAASERSASVVTKLRQKVLAFREYCSAQEQWINWKIVDGAITTALELFIY